LAGLETPPRIVLADDCPAILASVKALLVRDHFDVVGEALDGCEAVRMAAALHPDVVVLDRTMPHLNGFEAAHEISRSGASPRMILLTNHLAAHHVVRGLREGIRGFVSKRDAADELVHAVQTVCLGGTFFSAGALRVMRDDHLDTDPGIPPATHS
jgi:two-component system, NarL family, nitrate/nitrite response regulator NarL